MKEEELAEIKKSLNPGKSIPGLIMPNTDIIH